LLFKGGTHVGLVRYRLSFQSVVLFKELLALWRGWIFSPGLNCIWDNEGFVFDLEVAFFYERCVSDFAGDGILTDFLGPSLTVSFIFRSVCKCTLCQPSLYLQLLRLSKYLLVFKF
jgi:hypothetical protein